jgi:N-acetylmuramoyl-L-alanine amidase
VVAVLALCLAYTGPTDLEEIAARKDLQWTCDAATGRHVIQAGRTTVAVVPGFSRALVNGTPFSLAAPAVVSGGRLKRPPELVKLVLDHAPDRGSGVAAAPLAKAVPSAPEAKPRPAARLPVTIAIDPGHGGMHTGGKGRTGLLEKDINLDVALELRKILESWGATVKMTRTVDRHFSADVDDDLQARVDLVNRSRPDLFVSIHTNYVDNPGPRGYEVWVPKNAAGVRNAESRRLARCLLNELAPVWPDSEDRGIKDEHNLRVLKGTTCPAALIELEFVSNRAAEIKLARADVRASLAAAIADAIRRWDAGR